MTEQPALRRVISLPLLVLYGLGTTIGAGIYALIVLGVFALVNLALWRLKRRVPQVPGAPNVPIWVPIAGFLVSTGFVIAEAGRLLLA